MKSEWEITICSGCREITDAGFGGWCPSCGSDETMDLIVVKKRKSK